MLGYDDDRWKKYMLSVIYASDEFNGHNQAQLSAMAFDAAIAVMAAVKEDINRERRDPITVKMEVWEDQSASISAIDYWGEGEHHLGHRDKLILGIGKLITDFDLMGLICSS